MDRGTPLAFMEQKPTNNQFVNFLYRICHFRVSSQYSLRNFAHDIKEAIQFACIENEQIVLVLEDYQLLDESFLQMINALLGNGNVHGLYSNSQQELEQLLTRLRCRVKLSNLIRTCQVMQIKQRSGNGRRVWSQRRRKCSGLFCTKSPPEFALCTTDGHRAPAVGHQDPLKSIAVHALQYCKILTARDLS